MKERLAVARESAEGWPIQVAACDAVAEYGGWWSLQMQLIHHFLNEAGIDCPQKDAEVRRLAKRTGELSYRALGLLLQLARDYSPNPFELTHDHFTQALAGTEPPLTLADFAHLRFIPQSADARSSGK